LGWANAMYILAKEKYEKDINRKWDNGRNNRDWINSYSWNFL
jgi:hypothetical protein